MPSGSRIFSGYRALGFVSNHVPICLRFHQKLKEVFIITCVGKSFHMYNSSKLGIISVGRSEDVDISCMAVDAYLIYTAIGPVIKAYARKGREEVHVYRSDNAFPVHTLLPFGRHLLSVNSESGVRVWDIDSQELYLEIGFDKQSFEVTCVLHPSTYLNKLLFGSKQGSLQLWNLLNNKLLYTFTGWNTHITVLEQAPAVDVVAVGLSSGHIHLHNIKYDETIVSFHQDWGPITAISFRTDGHPVMVSGSPAGHLALWNLEEKKLMSQIREAHDGAVTSVECLPSEPLMVTSSPDNSLKVWIFDMPDGSGRLLRQRSGHSAPPTKVRYHGNNGQVILSSGQDSTMRNFSTIHEQHDRSLGRASYHKKKSKKAGLKLDKHKMPPVVSFASESCRESDWDGIVACHHGDCLATTWNLQRSTMGQHKLCHQRFEDKRLYRGVSALCCDVTSCGNFTVIGYSSGHVDLYNMQSGLYRGSYGQTKAHTGSVRGVCTDALNQLTISGGADCKVNFWKFKQKNLLQSVELPSQVAAMILHRESGMLAVSTDDFTVSVLDIETRNVVRRFSGHMSSVTDMTFSSDSRWLVTAAMDATIRTWDLPSGSLIDCVSLDSAVTSLSLSPTGDFLATAHVDDVGIYLWSNKTIYSHVALHPLAADYVPSTLQLPTTQTPQVSEEMEEDDESVEESDEVVIEFKSPDQISAELVTLSLLPTSRWQNLLNLDIIKERNKPKEPPKVPKAAPFFLPTVPGLTPTFMKTRPEEEKQEVESGFLKSILPLTEFGRLLTKSAETGEYDAVLSHLKSLGPSSIDVELRSLSPEGGGSVQLMSHFLTFINNSLHTNRDFEVLQAYLGLFLKLHGEAVGRSTKLSSSLAELEDSHRESWTRLQHSFQQSLCLTNYLRSSAL